VGVCCVDVCMCSVCMCVVGCVGVCVCRVCGFVCGGYVGVCVWGWGAKLSPASHRGGQSMWDFVEDKLALGEVSLPARRFFSCHSHSTIAAYTLIHLSPTLYYLNAWHRR